MIFYKEHTVDNLSTKDQRKELLYQLVKTVKK